MTIPVDVISMIAGAVVAAGLAILIFTQRERILALRSSAEESVTTTRAQLSRNAETRYRDAVVTYANGLHLAGHLVPLEQIAVIPSFYALPQPFDPTVEDSFDYDRPQHLLPLTTDWPQAVAPYHIPEIPLDKLLRGEQSVALLGKPGSGRTVTLALVSLLVARQTEIGQEGSLDEEPRLPIYFHLSDLNLAANDEEEAADPLDPMTQAAALRLRGLASRLIGSVAGEFARGNGLILADGWDELPVQQQQHVIEWLRVLTKTYPGNKLVIVAGETGYQPLIELGLATVYMMPWSTDRFVELGYLWAKAWPDVIGTAKDLSSIPAEDLVRRASRSNMTLTPLDAALHVWATYAGDDPGLGRLGWYDAYLRRTTPEPELFTALERLADIMIGRPDQVGMAIDEVSPLVDNVRSTVKAHISTNTPDYIFTVTNDTHILTEHSNGNLSFTHPLIQAYLASKELSQRPFRESLLEGNRFGSMVLPFLAQQQDITPYVEYRLNQPYDVLYNRVLDVAQWAANTSQDAIWRNDIFTRLSRFLIGPSQFPVVRERTMAALVASRDPNIIFIFKEGLKSEDSRIRMLCVLGLGAHADPETVATLGELLRDPDPTVEVAVALALGAMGTKSALNYLLEILVAGGDLARRAAAEMLAVTNIAGEGHDVLKEAASEVDPAARKAAVYGLHRVNEPWAVDMIGELEKRDDQWAVRAAAGVVMDMRRAGEHEPDVPQHCRKPHELNWLNEWLAERNESASTGVQGISQLVRALQEGSDATRLAATEALAALGAYDAVKPLYNALRDDHPEVRDAAYRALGAISLATGHALSGVM